MKKEMKKKHFMRASVGAGVRVEVVYDYKHVGDDKTGKCGTVWVRVYVGRDRRSYVSTGVKVLPSQWSDSYGVIGRPDAAKLNEAISEQVRATCDRFADEVSELAAENIKVKKSDIYMRASDTKVSRSKTEWLDWLEEKIYNERGIAKNTKAHHIAMLHSLEEWGKMKMFADVRAEVVKKYISWLYEKTVRKNVNGVAADVPISDAGVYGYTKYFRKFVREAQEEGKVSHRALVGIDFRKGTPSKRIAFSDDEIDMWLNVELDKPYLCDARDRFVVQMATGLAYCDLISTDFSNCQEIDGMMVLSGRRTKTNKDFFLVILPMAHDIIRRWNGVVPNISNVKYNQYLREVAAIAGINKPVTSHIGRHTYACHILRHGVRLEAVQRTLGHSRIQTTQQYARLVDMDVIDAFSKLK